MSRCFRRRLVFERCETMTFDPKALDEFVRRNARAKAKAEQALRDNSDDVATLCTVAALFDGMGDFAAASAVAERAVAVAPDNADAHIQRGVVRRHLGDFPAALDSFRRAVQLRPLAGRAYHEIAQMSDLSRQEGMLETLVGVFEQVRSDPRPALRTGHAIAKLLEDRGDYDDSFDWLVRAKQGAKQQQPYDHAAAERLHRTASECLAKPANGFESAEPIFIVGLPRTGTTLIDRIISSHPDVQAAGEISNWPLLVNCVAGRDNAEPLGTPSLHAAANFDASILGRGYVESTRPFTGQRPHFTDKSPMNYLLAGIIHRALPNARIVCVRRHPMDTCLSIFRQPLPVHQYSFSFDVADCARYFLLFDRFIAACREKLPSDRFAELNYESLVNNFEPEVRKLIAFCGLDWDPRCLRFQENDAPVATPSGQQVRAPIYRSSVGKWRKYGEKLRPAIEILAQGGMSDLT